MMRRVDEAAAVAQPMFPPGAEVAACLIGAAPPPWPSEAPAVAAAVPARQAEFAAGRAAVRAALDALGLPAVAVPVGQTRAPVWPSGIVGSITHSDGLALAVLAPARQCAGLGFDAEPDAPFPEDLVESVTRPEERLWLARQPDPLTAARMIFVAKEAAYKCQFPASRAVLGFDALRIGFGADGKVEAVFTIPVPPFAVGQRLKGRVARGAGLIMAGFTRGA
jgi:4'-phosphopantetheinyl transferase EntD